MAYATIQDVKDRMNREMSESEQAICSTMLDDASVFIDAYNANAKAEAKKIVACRIVIRQLGDGELGVPIGATQGSMSGLGYSQSWTVTGGSVGEMYLSKADKKLLECGNRIGAYSPVEEFS